MIKKSTYFGIWIQNDPGWFRDFKILNKCVLTYICTNYV